MRARLIDLEFTFDGKQRITFETDENFSEKFDSYKGKDLKVDVKKFSSNRSLSANAYFHVLTNKIADELQRQGMPETNTEIKRYLVREYGTLAKYENGEYIAFKLPYDADVNQFYDYTKCFDVRWEDGKEFACYLAYKRTRDMTNAEMCRLIEGAILECHMLGIETDPPQEIARLEKEWLKEKDK